MSRYCKQGFTLIELLVVLVIVAIATTMAVMHFFNRGGRRQIQSSRYLLDQLVRVTSQRATLYPGILGIDIKGDSVACLRYVANATGGGQWQALPHDTLSRASFFPPGVVISLKLKQGEHRHKGVPELIFYPNGFNQPVTLTVTNQHQNPVYHYQLLLNGQSQWSKAA